MDIASPKGGKIGMDSSSDPRDPSGYSAHDLISMGFIHTPRLASLLENTKALSEANAAGYDAMLICGGQAPMFTFREDKTLQALITRFYESEKPVAALCHGVAALMDVRLADGSYLIAGKTMTNIEEEFADRGPARGRQTHALAHRGCWQRNEAPTTSRAVGKHSPCEMAG